MGIMIAIGIALMSGLLVGLALPHGPASQSQTLLLLAGGFAMRSPWAMLLLPLARVLSDD